MLDGPAVPAWYLSFQAEDGIRDIGVTGVQTCALPISMPVAFQGVVLAIHGLHDFRWKPMLRLNAQPRDTLSDGTHVLVPDDIATIYDIAPLYKAGIDGTGQKLAVMGQTDRKS